MMQGTSRVATAPPCISSITFAQRVDVRHHPPGPGVLVDHAPSPARRWSASLERQTETTSRMNLVPGWVKLRLHQVRTPVPNWKYW